MLDRQTAPRQFGLGIEIMKTNPLPLMILPVSLVITASSAQGLTLETEPNNSSSTADSIVPEDGMVGQLLSESDQDWFGFSMRSAGAVQLTFDSPTNTRGVTSRRSQRLPRREFKSVTAIQPSVHSRSLALGQV